MNFEEKKDKREKKTADLSIRIKASKCQLIAINSTMRKKNKVIKWQHGDNMLCKLTYKRCVQLWVLFNMFLFKMTHRAHTYTHTHKQTHPSFLSLEVWWIFYLASECLNGPFIFFLTKTMERIMREGGHRNNKTAPVTGRPTHLSQSSHQWLLSGNWGCQSGAPAELLCSSCSSPTEFLQNKQRTKLPETSRGKKRKTR